MIHSHHVGTVKMAGAIELPEFQYGLYYIAVKLSWIAELIYLRINICLSVGEHCTYFLFFWRIKLFETG